MKKLHILSKHLKICQNERISTKFVFPSHCGSWISSFLSCARKTKKSRYVIQYRVVVSYKRNWITGLTCTMSNGSTKDLILSSCIKLYGRCTQPYPHMQRVWFLRFQPVWHKSHNAEATLLLNPGLDFSCTICISFINRL